MNFVDKVDDDVKNAVHDLFQYHEWTMGDIEKGANVRITLEAAYCAILHNVPPSPSRTRALNHIVDARMLANAAITHKGKY